LSRQKIRVTFLKTGDMRYISHLDVLRLFDRALRRAGLPIEFTKGFNPRPRMSFKRALKLGLESASEEAVFYMAEAVLPVAFVESMNSTLPEGIRMSTAEEEKL